MYQEQQIQNFMTQHQCADPNFANK